MPKIKNQKELASALALEEELFRYHQRAMKPIEETIEYRMGYTKGFNEGYSEALEILQREFEAGRVCRPIQILVPEGHTIVKDITKVTED